jgi:hypothetical protein
MTIATNPREAKCAAYFSIDAAVSPRSGASATAGALPSAENPFGVNIFPWHSTPSL